MDDLDKYIERRKRRSPQFKKDFDKGYEQFKIGVLLNEMHRVALGCKRKVITGNRNLE